MENEKKKDHSNVAPSEWSAETDSHASENAIPSFQFSTDRTQRQQGIVEKLLPCGKENAISSKLLAQLVGCSNVRTLQSLVAIERQAGALILSSTSGGYYLPDEGEKGQGEILEFYRALRARAINTLCVLRAAKNVLQQVEGQTIMEDAGDG